MRSWRGSLGQPLRGPASGRNHGRGDDPEPTENHVSRVDRLKFIIMHKGMLSANTVTKYLSKLSSKFLLLLRSTFPSSRLHSEEDTEERFDNRGGKCSRLVQRLRDAGVSWTRRCLEALSLPLQPGNPLHSKLGSKIPPLPSALMSWPHLHAWYECFPKRVDKKEEDFNLELERCVQTTKLCCRRITSMICTHKA